MDLKPQKPIREWRFLLTLRYNNGEEIQKELTPEEDAKMNELVQQMADFLKPIYPVSRVTIDIGDRKERWIPKDQKPLPDMNTLDEVAGEIQ